MHVSRHRVILLILGLLTISFGYQNCAPTSSFEGMNASSTSNQNGSNSNNPYIYDDGQNAGDNTNYSVITPTPTPSATPSTTSPVLPVISNSESRPVWRVYNPQSGDHLFTINADEANSLVSSSGWVMEGTPFSVFINNGSNLAPMVRCYIPSENDHFISGQESCENASVTQEGIMGYMPLAPTGDAIAPLYRCVNTSSPLRHLAVLDAGECSQAGYRVEGVVGYVVPPVRNVRRVYHSGSYDHLFTVNDVEAQDLIGSGWVNEGAPFKLLALRVNESFRPLYRCYFSRFGDHFVSVHSNCESSEITQEGLMGYIAMHPAGAAQAPLYRCVSSQGGLRHLATLQESECQQAGWASEGIVGYVVP